jgi:predicted DNA-binding protein (MmcQ/YjbR family)
MTWPSHVTPTGQPSVKERRALERLRDICRFLPETVETTTFGHPTFQAGKRRTFAVLDDHEQPGMLCLVLKLEAPEQANLIEVEGFFLSKFGARHGWTAMRVDDDTDWSHAKRLVLASYRLVALKRMVTALDARYPAAPGGREKSTRQPTTASVRRRRPG